jgi:hypothetical protein
MVEMLLLSDVCDPTLESYSSEGKSSVAAVKSFKSSGFNPMPNTAIRELEKKIDVVESRLDWLHEERAVGGGSGKDCSTTTTT